MGEITDNISNFLLVGGAIALVWSGISVAKPNLHGIKFVEGNCTITRATTIADWDELPSCTCGKSCSEEYPCVTVYASFESSDNGTSFDIGTIHKDYQALSSDCLVIPVCSSDFDDNARTVYSYFVANIVPRVDYDYRYPYLAGWNVTAVNYTDVSSFECWGYDHNMYIEHDYSVQTVYLSLGIPAGCIVVGVLIALIAGSDGQREMVGVVIALPFLIIVGIFTIIPEAFGCSRFTCSRHDCVRICCRCCVRSNRTRTRRRRNNLARFVAAVSTEGSNRDNGGNRSQRRRSSSPPSLRTRSVSETSIRTRELAFTPPRGRRHSLDYTGSSAVAVEFNLQPYPSSVAPPSYTEYTATAPRYPASPTASITAPHDVSPTMDLPPPSYNDVMAADGPTLNTLRIS